MNEVFPLPAPQISFPILGSLKGGIEYPIPKNEDIKFVNSKDFFLKSLGGLERYSELNFKIHKSLLYDYPFNLQFRDRWIKKNMKFIQKDHLFISNDIFQQELEEEYTKLLYNYPKGNLLNIIKDKFLLYVSGEFMNELHYKSILDHKDSKRSFNSKIEQVVVDERSHGRIALRCFNSIFVLKMNSSLDVLIEKQFDEPILHISFDKSPFSSDITLFFNNKTMLIFNDQFDLKNEVKFNQDVDIDILYNFEIFKGESYHDIIFIDSDGVGVIQNNQKNSLFKLKKLKTITKDPYHPFHYFTSSDNLISLLDIRMNTNSIFSIEYFDSPIQEIIVDNSFERKNVFGYTRNNLYNFSIKEINEDYYKFRLDNLMLMKSFKNTKFMVSNEKAHDTCFSRYISGLTLLKNKNFITLFQSSDIGDVFFENYSFDKSVNTDDFYQKMKHLNYDEFFYKDACYTPSLELFYNKIPNNIEYGNHTIYESKILQDSIKKEKKYKDLKEVDMNQIKNLLEKGPLYLEEIISKLKLNCSLENLHDLIERELESEIKIRKCENTFIYEVPLKLDLLSVEERNKEEKEEKDVQDALFQSIQNKKKKKNEDDFYFSLTFSQD